MRSHPDHNKNSKQGSDIPSELARAFTQEPLAKEHFLALSYSHQQEYVRWIQEARNSATRERRAAQTIMRLLTS